VLQALLERAQGSVQAQLVPRTALDVRRREAHRARGVRRVHAVPDPGVPGERPEASARSVQHWAPAQPEASAVPQVRRPEAQVDAAAELLPGAAAEVSDAEVQPPAAGVGWDAAAVQRPEVAAAAARQDVQREAVAGQPQAAPGAVAQHRAADPSAVPSARPSDRPRAPVVALPARQRWRHRQPARVKRVLRIGRRQGRSWPAAEDEVLS
jgi:hypothetical protein